jgi:sorbitol-specific phosphotransferase system component IIBC
VSSPNETEHIMDDTTKNKCLEVNGLLMAVHNEDGETVESILNDSGEDQVDLLLRSVITLKSMTDMLIMAMEDLPNVVVEDINFPSLVQVHAEYLLSEED